VKARRIYFRMPVDGPEQFPEFLPEAGDFLVVSSTGTTYRVLESVLRRRELRDGTGETWLHFRLKILRVPPAERPEDAMTWSMMWDGKRTRR
jgi:hypothetical protein